ncbi:class I SAM-dependent methyltransferase [Bailinhaonella thermotolerans]|uniref:Methyltransferase domain-containing protein n=1 Tax=Bailinhaonella thermotolerans TaxID=1070861 RepID=A0A3A4B547_9ACTN|nr:class I SAM-dependent methyltransferase [Bailinhaonella thermotolerans]RJL35730.1 methyltransferase domain-containing protein [Bailinhaonella thermotolerans]
MTLATDHYDRLLAQHYTYMLGGDLTALAAEQARLLEDLGVTPSTGDAVAVDLGCGPGPQTLALARLGFASVLAVDTSEALLAELVSAAAGDPAIRPVHADIRTALPEIARPGTVEAVVCMGDTLTHLPGKNDVTALLGDVTRALAPGGRLVITYRDLTRPLTGPDRFILVRGTADRLLTCFLEYRDDDTVLVHDLVHTRTGDTWTQRVGSYPKLRIGADWLAAQTAAAGLTVSRDEIGPRGMRVLVAGKEGA